MTQRSFHWDGASLGDAEALTVNAADGIGYRLANEDYESPFVDIGMRMLFNGDEDRGVLNNWLNELAVTGVATPVAVDTGGAVVYGMPYENTVAVNVAVVAPTTDVRQDLVVLRRDWAAQTIRITLITGVEGGGVPAHTQSPAPDGDGIYDIPLASLSTTVGAVITVTDMREFCLFGTGIADDAFTTTHLNNDSVDFIDRATRDCVLFIGAGDLEEIPITRCFSSGPATGNPMTSAVVWDGASNTSGWRMTGAGSSRGVQGSLWLPPANYASGDIVMYHWWTSNVNGAATFYLRSAAQMKQTTGLGANQHYASNNYDTATISETAVQHDIYRDEGLTILDDDFSAPLYDDYNLCIFAAWWYNSAGAEDINYLGTEFRYTGYA